jgi:cellulose synthase/poly-beta-1,6-N-acetylglucosamine synthase-like glycosyltransferase
VKLVHEPRKGISPARHAGYLAATGDLIANVDADTMLTPGWIGKVLKEFSQNPNLVALSGPFLYYDASAFTRALTRSFYGLFFAVYLLNNYVFRISSMLQGGNYIIRKTALDKLGGYDLKYDFWGEDADMARRLHPLGKVKFTFGLPIFSSGRRLAKEGVLKTGWKYTANFFGVILLKKPVTKKYQDIRSGGKNKL